MLIKHLPSCLKKKKSTGNFACGFFWIWRFQMGLKKLTKKARKSVKKKLECLARNYIHEEQEELSNEMREFLSDDWKYGAIRSQISTIVTCKLSKEAIDNLEHIMALAIKIEYIRDCRKNGRIHGMRGLDPKDGLDYEVIILDSPSRKTPLIITHPEADDALRFRTTKHTSLYEL
jgi:hypothetical protein